MLVEFIGIYFEHRSFFLDYFEHRSGRDKHDLVGAKVGGPTFNGSVQIQSRPAHPPLRGDGRKYQNPDLLDTHVSGYVGQHSPCIRWILVGWRLTKILWRP
jgi:hypothetical protein